MNTVVDAPCDVVHHDSRMGKIDRHIAALQGIERVTPPDLGCELEALCVADRCTGEPAHGPACSDYPNLRHVSDSSQPQPLAIQDSPVAQAAEVGRGAARGLWTQHLARGTGSNSRDTFPEPAVHLRKVPGCSAPLPSLRASSERQLRWSS